MNKEGYLNTASKQYYSINQSVSIVSMLIATMLFLRCMPYFMWEIETASRITCSILISLLGISFCMIKKDRKLPFFLFFFSFLIVGISRGTGFLQTINVVLLSLVMILDEKMVLNIYKYFKHIFSFFLLISIIVYIFVSIFDIDPIEVIKPINILKVYNYAVYPFLIVPDSNTYLYTDILRFHGMFDEPGVVGTFCGLLLCIEKFRFKKVANYILLIGGLLSLSFYFYAIVIFGFLFFYSKSTNNKGLFFFFLILLILYNIPFFQELLFNRFLWDSDTGKLLGDNRGGKYVAEILAANRFSMNYFFGYGYDASKEYMGGASIYLLAYREGVLFVGLNIIAYIVLAFKIFYNKNKRAFWGFIFILLATFYQRPGLLDIVYIFLFITMIYSFSKKND